MNGCCYHKFVLLYCYYCIFLSLYFFYVLLIKNSFIAEKFFVLMLIIFSLFSILSLHIYLITISKCNREVGATNICVASSIELLSGPMYPHNHLVTSYTVRYCAAILPSYNSVSLKLVKECKDIKYI